jgi:putative ABC transport system permease protein
MSLTGRDARFALRMLRKNPGFAIAATLTFALGISLTTTIFSIAHGVMRDLPFDDPERIVALDTNQLSRGIDSRGIAPEEYLAWKDQLASFEGLAAFDMKTVNLSGTERPERFEGGFVTANAFPLLRVRPVLGRTFLPEEDVPGAPNVVLLGHTIWKNRYGRDPQIVGKNIKVNAEPAVVVGVMPEGFQFPLRQAVWVPLKLHPPEGPPPENQRFLFAFGRLRPGIPLDQATGEAAVLAGRYAAQHPQTNEGVSAVVKPYTHLFVDEEDRTIQYATLALVSLVLLIACINVANLLVARTLNRSKEVAVRAALGASQGRVMRQLLMESLVLSLLGAAFGIGLTFFGVRLFNLLITDPDRPFWINVKVDQEVILFAIAAGLVSSVVAGLIPAYRASRADLSSVLKDEARGSSSFRLGRLSKGLVVIELALSYGLLIAAGLTVSTVVRLAHADLGFQSENIFTARIGLTEATYPEPAGQIAFFEELLRRIEAVPGVASAAVTSHLPTSGSEVWPYAVEGRAYATANDYPQLRSLIVSPGAFDTFGIPLLQGEPFKAQGSAAQAPVAVVSRSFAERVWPGESPVGKRIQIREDDSGNPWRTIIGVVPDVQLDGVRSEDPAAVYLPLAQNPRRFMSIAVRTTGHPAAAAAALRAQLAALDRDLPIYWEKTMEQVVAQNKFLLNVVGSVFTIFGVLALVLAMVGLYGIMSFTVSRRIPELGVRQALGAQSRDILRLILRQALRQILIGLGIGLLVALGMAQLVSSVFGVTPWDLLTFALTAALLVLVGFTASLIPASRATRVHPTVALQSQ